MDFREEMLEAYRRAEEAHPGLGTFRSRKKGLLWGMMGLFALSKLLLIAGMWGRGSVAAAVIGSLLGMVLPGIFALTAWRGNWRFAFVLLLPAANIALDLCRSGIPALLSGERYVPLFYAVLALSAVTCLYLVGVVLWLTVPARNRAYGDALNQVTEALILRSKEIAAQQKAQGGPGQPAPFTDAAAIGAVPLTGGAAVPPQASAPVPPQPPAPPAVPVPSAGQAPAVTSAPVPPQSPAPSAAPVPPAEPAPAAPQETEYLSCFRQIEAAAGEDGLPDSFSLQYPSHQKGKLRFVDGAMDGITMYHTRVEPKDDPALHEILALVSAGYLQAEERLNSFFDDPQNDPRMLCRIDSLQDWILGHKEELNPGMLYRFAGHIIRESCRPECVKLGLCLLEMLHGSPEEEAELRRVITTLALCDEFTLFCYYVIRGWEDAGSELFRLAKLVRGWGRVFLVHDLSPDTPEVRDWLLREGWRNTVLSNYSAALCARKGGLGALLERETLTAEEWTAARELTAALLEEQPLPGLSGMEDGPALVEGFLRHAAARQRDEADRAALEQLAGYLESRDQPETAGRCRALLAE